MKADELVDLVDATGDIQLRGIRRDEVRDRKEEFVASGLYQPIVVVVVLDEDGRVVAHERGQAKGDDGAGEIDHVCGVISSGESWRETAVREALEELGVQIRDLCFVAAGVNIYDRHRTLAVAQAIGAPRVVDHDEVGRLLLATVEELVEQECRSVRFVRGFFDDLRAALTTRAPGPMDATAASPPDS